MAKIQKNQVVNLAAKMDNLSNSEVLNLNVDETGMIFEYLENADLYNTKALKNRKGVQDKCGGVVNSALNKTEFIDTTSGVSIFNVVFKLFHVVL